MEECYYNCLCTYSLEHCPLSCSCSGSSIYCGIFSGSALPKLHPCPIVSASITEELCFINCLDYRYAQAFLLPFPPQLAAAVYMTILSGSVYLFPLSSSTL